MKRLLILLLLPLMSLSARAAEEPSFERDIMPILFRAGCNAGTCHGSARGKDGFMLSLFGYDAKGDYYRLSEEMVGRRINLAAPEQSLFLLKATGKVPHTGGERFDEKSAHYQTVLDWIKAGAPNDAGTVAQPVEITLLPEKLLFDGKKKTEQTKVMARYSDGTTRDVTSLALFFSNNPDTVKIDENGLVTPGQRGDTFVFARFNRFTIGSEVVVLPANSKFKWASVPANNYIDELVYDRLKKLELSPSGVADDETFLRRAYLDLTGALPAVEQYNSFMADAAKDKRTKLVDTLIASEGFTELWTMLWGESVRLMGGGYTPTATDIKAADAYYRWIRDQMAANRPINEFVAEQITATGSNLTEGPANLYTMLVHAPRFTPKIFAADFSQLMTGIQIQCAECHNHPFDRWTMDDYYGFVSFFTGMNRKSGAEPRQFYIYNDIQAKPASHLIDERPMPATVLGGEKPAPGGIDQRQALAEWLTSPDNELFAKNFVNRVWAQFFHRGLVEPVDDMRISNPATNPPLLDALAKRFVDSKFNLRALVRDIATSRVYQLSVQPNDTNEMDDRQFSRAQLRRLRADVLLDSIVKATDSQYGFSYFPAGTKAVQYYPRSPGGNELGNAGNAFFETFGRSKRASICSCETKPEPTLSQTLHLLVGDTIDGRVGGGKVVPNLIKAGKTPDEILDELYIRALSRKPDAEERAALLALVAGKEKDAKAFEDIFTSLLNSTEFAFNH